MEAERRRAILVRAVRLLGLVMFPLAVGLGLVAPTIVHVFFKRKWADVAPMLVLLSALSVPRPIGMALSNYLQAHRRPRMVTLIEIANTAVLMAAIATVGRISPLWTCATVGVVFTLRALVTMFVLRASDGISVASLLGSQLPPAIACLPMAGAVLGVRWLLAQSDHDGTWYALLAEVAAGGVAYAGAALLVARQASRELFGLLRRTRGG
jgi:PST family polysaccharide transporter